MIGRRSPDVDCNQGKAARNAKRFLMKRLLYSDGNEKKMNFSQGVLTNDPTSCAGYFMCVHDKLQPFTCQDGTHWDDTQKVVLQFELDFS